MKKTFVIFFCWVLTLSVQAQNTPTTTKPAIAWKDVATWKSIPNFGGVQLSPDGQWAAYVLAPNEGDAELIVQKTTDTTKYTYAIGSVSFASMSFAEDSKWLAFKVYPKDKDKKAATKTPDKPLTDKLFLVELANNKKTEFERVKSFAFNADKSTHLAVLLAPVAAKPDGAKGSDLLIYDLKTAKTQNVGNVSEMAFNKSGDWLALAIDANEKAGNALHLRNMNNATTLILDNDKATYRSLNWTEKGDALALLKGTKDEKYKNDRHAVLGVRNLATTPELTVYDPKTDSLNFPIGMTISQNRAPLYTEDLSRLLFGIHKLELTKKEDKKPVKNDPPKDPKPTDNQQLAKIKADTTIKSIADLAKALAKISLDTTKKSAAAPAKEEFEKPDMVIWNWQDKRLQARQQVQETQDKNQNYLSMYDWAAKRFMQLTDSTLKAISPAPKQLYAIGVEESPYELDINLDGQNYADIYAIDLKTGSRSKVLEKLYLPNFSASPVASPDGTKFLYAKDGNFWLYDMPTKQSRNLTEKLPTSFVNTDDDRNVQNPPTPQIGWSNDSKYVLVRDLWDIWKLPVEVKEAAVNLTQNGKSQKIRYQGRFFAYPDEKGIDLKLPQYFRIYGERNKKSGIARLENGLKVSTLIWEDAAIGSLLKAKKSNTFLFSRETFTDPADYFLSNSPLLDNAKQITKNAPSFDKYAWSKGVQLVNYVSDKGDSLQGALFLPAGYEQGKKYPTIVYYYEKLSQTLHSFANPNYSGTGWNPSVYTSNGYAVFVPDIVYKLNDPGMSAVWCVLPAVKAALQTGIIDEARVGIHGHSWGGYQTSFLITQTAQFKAAAAGAPLTDLVSMYNLVYRNSGNSNGSIFEASQGRLQPPWENWEAYYRNSPMHHVKKVSTPLLMLHNDADGAVDFTQGIEYYNALRRLKKPVVLIQYKGENHGLAKLPNRKDYAQRMMEFFDHYLKGQPAPEWWSKGVSKLDLEGHLEKRANFGQE